MKAALRLFVAVIFLSSGTAFAQLSIPDGILNKLGADSTGPMLTGSDLEAMNLGSTRLVVLSACDTGNGTMDVHEGLTSLRRAAQEAGKPNSEALRLAKISVRDAGGGTRDLAGFILAGADR